MAAALDLSDQAVTERLRRVIATLVTNTLIASEPDGWPPVSGRVVSRRSGLTRVWVSLPVKNVLTHQATALGAPGMSNHHMDGVLNENTKTVHKRRAGRSALQSACGHTNHVDPGRLRPTSVEQATVDSDAEKCGGCFEDAGGY